MRLRSEFRSLYGAIGLTLVLSALISAGSAGIAAAAAPVFQGIITSPTLCSPRGTAVTPGGDVFVGSDCSVNQHMEQFDASGVYVGSWGFTPRYLGPPNGAVIDGSGNLYVTDMFADRVLKYTGSGALLDSWNGGPSPVDLAVDGIGDVYVASLDGSFVRRYTPDGVALATFGSPGPAPGQFQGLTGVAVDAGGRVYGADVGRARVVRFLANGTFDMEFIPPSSPSDVAMGPDGNLYVISFDSHQVFQYSPGGVLLQSFGSPFGFDGAYRIVISSAGMIYVTEQRTNRVTKFQIDLVVPATLLTFGRLKAIYR